MTTDEPSHRFAEPPAQRVPRGYHQWRKRGRGFGRSQGGNQKAIAHGAGSNREARTAVPCLGGLLSLRAQDGRRVRLPKARVLVALVICTALLEVCVAPAAADAGAASARGAAIAGVAL